MIVTAVFVDGAFVVLTLFTGAMWARLKFVGGLTVLMASAVSFVSALGRCERSGSSVKPGHM